MADEYQITPEMQAKIREQAHGQWLVALTRVFLNTMDDPNDSRARFLKVLDDLIDGYQFYHQPPEVSEAARDLMRQHLDHMLSQIQPI